MKFLILTFAVCIYVNTLSSNLDILYGKRYNTGLTLHSINHVYLLFLRLNFPDVVKVSFTFGLYSRFIPAFFILQHFYFPSVTFKP